MKAFDISQFEKYKLEAEEKWGKTEAFRQHAEKTKHYSGEKWNGLAVEMDEIFAEFASCKKNGKAPDSEEAQTLVKALQKHISENYYHCTDEILFGLGQMYVRDKRFQNHIDKHAEGNARFVSEAIEFYCK